MATIVVIEDEMKVREAISRSLASLGHSVETAATGITGLEMTVNTAPDLVVLDLGLPDVEGQEVLKMIRAVSAVPVIIATAQDDEAEVVRLLNSGADDYVIKPFSGPHLDARIRAVLRRNEESTGDDETIVIGDLTVDRRGRTAEMSGHPLELTRKEFDVLAFLAERPDTVVSKRELLAEVWRQPYGGADKTVDVHLSWLRKKLGESASEPRYLHTVRGVGVKLQAPEGS